MQLAYFKTNKPVNWTVFLVSAFMLTLPPTMAVVPHSATVIYVTLALLGIWLWKTKPKISLTKPEKLILRGFIVVFAIYFLSFLISDETYVAWKKLGKVAKFLFVFPVYIVLKKYQTNLFYALKFGLILVGPIFLLYFFFLDEERGEMGAYHSIIYGSFSMLLFGINIFLALLYEKDLVYKIALITSGIMCLATSFLVGARGSWIAIILLFILFSWTASRHSSTRKTLLGLFVLFFLTISVIFVSNPDSTQKRFQAAIDQTYGYFIKKDSYIDTSAGARLALWEISIDIWKKYPLFGAGLGDYRIEKDVITKQNATFKKSKGLLDLGAAHSTFFEWLALFGSIGLLLLLLFVYLLPLFYFIKAEVKQIGVPGSGLIGIWIVGSNMIFALTESTMGRSAFVGVFLLFTLITLATSYGQNTKKQLYTMPLLET